MKSINLLFNMILLLALVSSCGGDLANMDRERGYLPGAEPEVAQMEKYAEGEDNISSFSKPEVKEENRAADKGKQYYQENVQQNQGAKNETDEMRKHVYFGYIKLIVANLTEARNAVGQLAESTGGYIESSYERQVVIRIPKEKFNDVFAELMKLGDVEKKTIETYDVTEYFQDLQLQLSVAEQTRTRLYNLLERTQDVEQRLKILKEIKRLSEEIEKIRLGLETIKRLIAFSSITVELEQRLADVSPEDKSTIPFPWIGALDPFYPSITGLDGSAKPPLGDDFAVFNDKKYYFAESPDGVRVRVGTVPNKPSGDAEFWRKALVYHLRPFYRETVETDLGNVFRGVLFTSRDAKAFRYLIGIASTREKLFIIEVFFPDTATFAARFETVTASIKETKI